MKKIISILILFFTIIYAGVSFADSRLKISKDAFIRVLNPVEISGTIADIGDSVYFINVDDLYINEENVIPKNSRFYGVVEDLKEPVQGTNGSVKIRIDKLEKPDKTTIAIKGYIFSSNNNYIGGDATPPTYYKRTPHYTQGWRGGILQYTPTNIRSFGEPIIIKAGAELFVVLTEDLYLNN
ncbi:MAG: hypothetical protein PHV37_00090 [Candidatus Gastranaerophilales bacterium]|nr:hypothetical protein [Candidatus Gastranaerophilales bacterium]